MYGWPVGELIASLMLPARKRSVISIKKPIVKLSAAAPTMQRGSHLDASLSSSAK